MSRICIEQGAQACWGSAAWLPVEITHAQNDNHDPARKHPQAREQAVRAVDTTMRAADAVMRAAQDVIRRVEQDVPDPRQRDLFADILPRPVTPPLRRSRRRGRALMTASLAGVLSLMLVPDLPPAWTNQADSAIAAAASLVARLVEPGQPTTVAPIARPPIAEMDALPIQVADETPPAPAPAPLALAAIAPEPEPEPMASAPVVEAPPPVVASAAPTCGEPVDSAVLVSRAEEFVAAGDIASARLLFRRAALACDARAALALAATFDPLMLRRLGVRGVAPDEESARTWYLKARALGSTEASHRLAALGGQE
jgi:hypothetical protein